MDILKIQAEQDKFKASNGKNFQVKRGETKTAKGDVDVSGLVLGSDIEIHEMLCPDGSTGFSVFERDGNGMIQAVASGCSHIAFPFRKEHDDESTIKNG